MASASLWIPAFAGMRGEEGGNDGLYVGNLGVLGAQSRPQQPRLRSERPHPSPFMGLQRLAARAPGSIRLPGLLSGMTTVPSFTGMTLLRFVPDFG